jgi:Ser/Thr protein kinase RdoA (MazF antagonist)
MSGLARVMEAFGLPLPRAVRRPADGVLNDVRVLTFGGYRLVLKRYLHGDPTRVARDVEVMAEAARVVAVPALRSTLLGDAVAVVDGDLFTLQEHAIGHQVKRSDLQPEHAEAMGRAMAVLHRDLRPPDVGLPAYSSPPNRGRTLERIDQLLALIAAQDITRPEDTWARQLLTDRARWLHHQPTTDHSWDLVQERSFLHGDFTDVNLFFTVGGVSAVLDWEQAQTGPAGAEFMRCAHFCFGDRVELWQALLRGYRRERDFSFGDLEAAAELYGEHRAHALWEFDAVYREGNERARRYIVSPHFVPWAERWALLRPHLSSL